MPSVQRPQTSALLCGPQSTPLVTGAGASVSWAPPISPGHLREVQTHPSRWLNKGQACFCLEPFSPRLRTFPPPATHLLGHPGGVKGKCARRCCPSLLLTGDKGCPVSGLADRRKVVPVLLTSILQVMIPGSLPTALKALLRDMALIVLGLKHHRASGEMRPVLAGVHPTFFLSHF